MSKPAETILGALVTVAIFAVPAVVGAYWLSTTELPAAGLSPVGPPSPGLAPPAASLPSGVLYTGGSVLVDWNGVKIPVNDGRYAYLGGEVVSTGPDAMGVLQLDGGTVYFCPSSRASLSRSDDGGFDLRVSEGATRYVFESDAALRVHANRALLTPSADAGEPGIVGEVAVFANHPGGVVCSFQGATEVVGRGAEPSRPTSARGRAAAGEIVDMARALREEVASARSPVTVRPITMPPDVMASLRANSTLPGASGYIGYLCRCVELKRYAEADGIPDPAKWPRLWPPQAEALGRQAPDFAPPVQPPEAPPVTLATPGIPDPAALPPPTQGPADTTLTVPPPLVPTSGSGGGLSATPS